MKTQSLNTNPINKELLLNHNSKAGKESNTSFWEKLFFGPHKVEGEEINEAENEAIVQQLMWWSRME